MYYADENAISLNQRAVFQLIIFDVDYFARTKSDRQYFELKANRRKLGRILYVHLQTVDVLGNE